MPLTLSATMSFAMPVVLPVVIPALLFMIRSLSAEEVVAFLKRAEEVLKDVLEVALVSNKVLAELKVALKLAKEITVLIGELIAVFQGRQWAQWTQWLQYAETLGLGCQWIAQSFLAALLASQWGLSSQLHTILTNFNLNLNHQNYPLKI